MIIAVSPYHVTKREAPALASLLLADSVVTMVPAPLEGGGSEVAQGAARRVPTYLEFMKSWEWTEPLWNAGVLLGAIDGDTPAGAMHEVTELIEADGRYTGLRPLLRERLYDDERSYLGAIAADILKGGPDPGITVPLAAGLDRFATRQGVIVARSQAVSVAQKAEEKLGVLICSAAIPVLVQASAGRLLHAREVLEHHLGAVREEMAATTHDGASAARMLELSLAEYSRRFETARAEVGEGCADDEVRMIESVVALTVLSLPSDAVLQSSLRAMDAIGGGRRGERDPAPIDRSDARPGANLPALYDAIEGRRFTTVVVRPLGANRRR